MRSIGAVEEVDGRPEQILEVGFEAGIAQGRDEGVEDVGDGASDGAGFGQRPRVGLVLEGAIAVKLQFVQDVVGRGCGVRRLVAGVVVIDRHGDFLSSDRPRPSRPSWRRKAAGGPDLHRRAKRQRPKRSGGWRQPTILFRDVKRPPIALCVMGPRRAATENSRRTPLQEPGRLPLRSPSRRP